MLTQTYSAIEQQKLYKRTLWIIITLAFVGGLFGFILLPALYWTNKKFTVTPKLNVASQKLKDGDYVFSDE